MTTYEWEEWDERTITHQEQHIWHSGNAVGNFLEKAGTKVMMGAGIAAAIIIADDLTGIGVLDDVGLPVCGIVAGCGHLSRSVGQAINEGGEKPEDWTQDLSETVEKSNVHTWQRIEIEPQ